MAFSIDRKLLTRHEKEHISTFCKFIENATDYKKEETILMFEVEDDIVYVPLYYAKLNLTKRFTSFPNEHLYFAEWENKEKFGLELFDRQKELLPEIFQILERNHVLLLSLNCGWGKTIMLIYIAWILKIRILITVYRSNLIEQTRKSVIKCIKDIKIQVLDTKCDIQEADVYFIGVKSVCSRPRKDYETMGIFAIDEIHTVLSKEYKKILLHIQPLYLIGMSATPYKRGSNVGKIIDLHFGDNIIYRPLYHPHNVYIVNTGFSPTTKENKRGQLDWHDILEQQMNDKKRNKLIVKLCVFFKNRNILLLGKRVEHAKILKKKLKKKGENVDVFVENQTDYEINVRILATTISKGGVGFDAPHLDMIILTGDMTNDSGYFIQYLSRVFRKEEGHPIVIDLRDKFAPLYNHLIGRMIVYCNCGGYIRKFEEYFPEFSPSLND